MKIPQWIKKLSGHAGELYVCAELSKRGICNALLPENFSDDDIIIGKKDGEAVGFIQVKSCHPDRSKTFLLNENHENWVHCKDNQFVAFVWLGYPNKNEGPTYWIARKRDVGEVCKEMGLDWKKTHATHNPERRFSLKDLKSEWKDNWDIFKNFLTID